MSWEYGGFMMFHGVPIKFSLRVWEPTSPWNLMVLMRHSVQPIQLFSPPESHLSKLVSVGRWSFPKITPRMWVLLAAKLILKAYFIVPMWSIRAVLCRRGTVQLEKKECGMMAACRTEWFKKCKNQGLDCTKEFKGPMWPGNKWVNSKLLWASKWKRCKLLRLQSGALNS
jgi:hypothetical protein